MSSSQEIEKQLQIQQQKLLEQEQQKQQSWQLWKRINPGYDPTHTEKVSTSQRTHIDFPTDYKEKSDKTHFLKRDKYSEFVEARARFSLLTGETKVQGK